MTTKEKRGLLLVSIFLALAAIAGVMVAMSSSRAFMNDLNKKVDSRGKSKFHVIRREPKPFLEPIAVNKVDKPETVRYLLVISGANSKLAMSDPASDSFATLDLTGSAITGEIIDGQKSFVFELDQISNKVVVTAKLIADQKLIVDISRNVRMRNGRGSIQAIVRRDGVKIEDIGSDGDER